MFRTARERLSNLSTDKPLGHFRRARIRLAPVKLPGSPRMDWQPFGLQPDGADVLSDGADGDTEEEEFFAGLPGGCIAVHSGIPWSQVPRVLSAPSVYNPSSLVASPPLQAPIPWIPQYRGVHDHLPCAQRLRAKRKALLAEMGVIVNVLTKEVDREQRIAFFWHDKYVATKKELIALKDHVKQAERSTREAIASLDAEVRMYRRLLDPQ